MFLISFQPSIGYVNANSVGFSCYNSSFFFFVFLAIIFSSIKAFTSTIFFLKIFQFFISPAVIPCLILIHFFLSEVLFSLKGRILLASLSDFISNFLPADFHFCYNFGRDPTFHLVDFFHSGFYKGLFTQYCVVLFS